MKINSIWLVFVIIQSASSLPVGAEGINERQYGEYGANRRIRTTSAGYDAVEGTFSVPASTKIPFNNRARTKPSFYIGTGQAYSSTEFDAGVVYEGVQRFWNLATSSWENIPAGWAVFIARGIGTDYNSIYAAGAWRAGHNTPNPNVTSFYLFHGVDGAGRAYLEVTANGANAQPGDNGVIWWNNAAVGYTNGTAGLHAKRVVAISQGGEGITLDQGTYAEDGAYMRWCVFNNGRVGVISGTNFVLNAWSAAYIDQNLTGYYPGGRDRKIPRSNPLRHARGHLPIIHFPDRPISARDTVNAARYDNEIVDVNLRSFRAVRGKLVTPRRPNTGITD